MNFDMNDARSYSRKINFVSVANNLMMIMVMKNARSFIKMRSYELMGVIISYFYIIGGK